MPQIDSPVVVSRAKFATVFAFDFFLTRRPIDTHYAVHKIQQVIIGHTHKTYVVVCVLYTIPSSFLFSALTIHMIAYSIWMSISDFDTIMIFNSSLYLPAPILSLIHSLSIQKQNKTKKIRRVCVCVCTFFDSNCHVCSYLV